MTLRYMNNPALGSICSNCENDLAVRRQGPNTGLVFCTRRRCTYFRKPHPTGPNRNVPERFRSPTATSW